MKLHQNVGLALLTATLTAMTLSACGEDLPEGLPGDDEKSCDANAAQPSICSSGQFCNANGTCEDVPASTCGNVAPTGGHDADTTGTTGPTIYSLQQEGETTPDEGCTQFAVRVKAYRTQGTFPETQPELAAIFHVVDPSGTELNPAAIIDPSTIVRNAEGTNIEFLVRPCAAGVSGQYSFAAHFVDGNAVCETVDLQ